MRSKCNEKESLGKNAIKNLFVFFPFFVFVTCLSIPGMESAAYSQGGSLEPPSTAVDGLGNPVPTTQTQPSWDQILPDYERFVFVMGGVAVLDKETGLVWERSPSLSPQGDWRVARFHCTGRDIGNRKAWRLPSIHELASLIDTTVGSPPHLPAGHPFINVVTSGTYWSATTSGFNPNTAWAVDFSVGSAGSGDKTFSSNLAWCVRGGGPLSEY